MGTGYVLPRGEVEVDLVASRLSLRNGALSEVRLEVTYGLTSRVQVEGELLLERRSSGDGDDTRRRVEITGKWSVHSGSVAVVAASGGLELGSTWGTELAVSASGPWASAHARLHLELALETEVLEEVEAVLINAALERVVGHGFLVEVAWNGRFDDLGLTGAAVPAIEWRVPGADGKGPAVAVGLPIGVSSRAERWGLVLHIELEL